MMNLEKEIIDGYEVSARMKRIWAMELDMVRRFVEVCEEYHLQYWMLPDAGHGQSPFLQYLPENPQRERDGRDAGGGGKRNERRHLHRHFLPG